MNITDIFNNSMASRYSSSSSEEDEIISRYSLRPVKKSILKKEHSGGTYRGSTPPLTPLGGPETERSKLVTFDRPTKKVDGRAKFPGTPTSYPHPPSDPRYSGAKQTHTPVAKQSKVQLNAYSQVLESKLNQPNLRRRNLLLQTFHDPVGNNYSFQNICLLIRGTPQFIAP